MKEDPHFRETQQEKESELGGDAGENAGSGDKSPEAPAPNAEELEEIVTEGATAIA